MKKLILVVLAASALASSLTGCAGGFKSYYALQDECESGIVQSCKDLRSRDRVTAAAASGLEGYNQQQLIQAQQQRYMQPDPVATSIDNLNASMRHMEFQRQAQENFQRFNDNLNK